MVFSLFSFLGGSCLSRRPAATSPGELLDAVRLPLYHSKGAPNEGVFKVRLGIGDATIDLIIDSCSSDVIVVGEQCGRACQQSAGQYGKLKPTYTGKTTTISYVSQTNHVSWAKDDYSFPSAIEERIEEQLKALHPAPLHFGVITHNVSHVVQGGTMPGRSILGLMSVQRGSGRPGLGLLDAGDDASFINQVFGPKGIFKRAIYSIAIEPNGDGGELVLGGVHKGIKGWVPLVPASEVPSLWWAPQWVIRVKSALAVAHDGAILAELSLKYARFDTGNTWLSMPSAVFQTHGHLGELCSIAGLQFILDNEVTLWFPAPMFSGSVAMANATGFGGLAEDRSLAADWCIFGNEVMKGMVVACDLEKAMLGFGGMCSTVKDENWMDCEFYRKPQIE